MTRKFRANTLKSARERETNVILNGITHILSFDNKVCIQTGILSDIRYPVYTGIRFYDKEI